MQLTIKVKFNFNIYITANVDDSVLLFGFNLMLKQTATSMLVVKGPTEPNRGTHETGD